MKRVKINGVKIPVNNIIEVKPVSMACRIMTQVRYVEPGSPNEEKTAFVSEAEGYRIEMEMQTA